MVRSRISRSPRINIQTSHVSPPRSSLVRPNHSPGFRSSSRGRSPKHHTTSLKRNDARNDDQKPRGRYRGRDQRRRGNPRIADNSGRQPRNNQSGNRNKGRIWGIKKKRRRPGRGRGVGGLNAPPVSGGNRQPIASMRMRMDDYLPRSGRLLPLQKGDDIEHAVSRARREASTRTKDTFWTKKLLDAEHSHPNRWAHTGFKELYREELGYSGTEYKSGDEKSGKFSREEKGAKSFSSKNTKGSPSRRRSPSDKLQRTRKHASQSPSQKNKDKTKDFRSKVPSAKFKNHHSASGTTRLSNAPRVDKRTPLKPNKRHYSRSYSRSLSSLSSSGSNSRSRSYSSYSRSSSSSSTTSSSSSSSFSTSSSISLRSYSKHSYHRRSYSKSSSRSPSPKAFHKFKSPRQIIKKTSTTKMVHPIPKKKAAKTSGLLPKQKKTLRSSGNKAKARPLSPRPISPSITSVNKGGVPLIGPNVNLENEYYDPSVITEDSPPYRTTSNHAEKAPTHYDTESDKLPPESDPRLPVSEIDSIREIQVTNMGHNSKTESRKRITNSEGKNKASNVEIRRRAVNSDVRGKTSNSEIRPRFSNSTSKNRASNSEISRRNSESDQRQTLDTDARLAADLQRYKNSRLTRNTCQDTIILHPSGIRLKRERRSNSESSTDEEEYPMKLTLSERFGKLAQLSSQRQEYDGVRMKIVREGGQDKKVYLEGGSSRTPSPYSRRSDGAHERWLREHKADFDEYQQLYGEFRHWDPHRDLPNELPPNWDDINVRYRYYKESGYFGDRAITMDDYLKWEEWWYRYKDWLEKYGSAHDGDYRGGADFYDISRASTSSRWSRRDSHREKEERKRMRY